MSPCILPTKPYIANSLSLIDDYSEFSFEGEISQLQIEKSAIKAQRGGYGTPCIGACRFVEY